MGYFGSPDHQGRPRDHRPKNSIRGPPGQAPHQGPRARGRTLERTSETQSRPGKTPGPRPGPQHLGYKLALLGSQTQTTSTLPVEKHPRSMVEREAEIEQVEPNQRNGVAQTTNIRESPHHQRGPQSTWAQRQKQRKYIRQSQLLQDQELLGPGSSRVEKPNRDGSEPSPNQLAKPRAHHQQHSLEPSHLRLQTTDGRLGQQKSIAQKRTAELDLSSNGNPPKLGLRQGIQKDFPRELHSTVQLA
ncbi:unnamed protein product [Sphagnum balticum]